MVKQVVSPYGGGPNSITLESPKTGGTYDNSNITVSGDVPINSLSLNTSSRTLSFYVDSCAKGLSSTIKVPVINCNEYFDYEIPIKIESCTHPNLTYVSAKSATCTASGNDAYYKCTCSSNTLDKNGDITSVYIKPKGHDYTYKNTSSSRLRTSATCTSAATYYYECTRCSSYTTSSWFSYGNTISHNYSSGYCTMCNKQQPITITSNPSSTTVAEGRTAYFSVSASGYNLSYRWQQWTPTNPTWVDSSTTGYSTNSISLWAKSSDRNGWKVRCKITSANGLVVYSGAATLTVTS